MLQIDLFGGVAIRVDGQRITDLATRKAEALLIYLVCNSQPHQREALADLLWDDLPAERAAGNLRLTLNQLRKRFAPFLDITRQTIAFRQDVECRLDVEAFARRIATTPHDVERLAEALGLYRGDFLQGFHLRDARGFSEWQAGQMEYWQQQARTHMRTLVDSYASHSNYTEALRWASRILTLDPLDEAAHRQVMLLLARSGQRAAALRQYRACRQIMQQELEVDPEPATEALYQRISRMATQRPHNLPTCTRTLLARTAELARLYTWLATPASRLMSIIGPGGSGKTHLALTVGWRVVNEYLGPCSDGVFYIPLITHDESASLIDDTGLLIAIAEQLQIRFSGKSALFDQLIQQSRDKELLLIIDNGELLSPSARLALGTLIQHIPAMGILVPSRERLKLRAEHVLDINGLPYPVLPASIVTSYQQQRACAGIQEYESVQLFLACVRQVQGESDFGGYALPDQLAIGKICQIVHGLPLAIELVAPWIRVRSPVEIVREIAHTIDLIVVDMPDVPERHRSMRAVFEYSWRLMTDEERQALAHLSVFPASFTAEAAAAITSATLQQLAALHDKSLIQRIVAASGTRYVLHPVLRSLAQEKLQRDPATAAMLHAAHAGYFAAFVASYEEQLRSVQGPRILQKLECEMDNLRAGWQWAVEAHDLVKLGQYSIPLHDFCAIRGWELEGRHLFRMAAAVIHAWKAHEDTPESQLLSAARVLSCYAELEYVLGALDTAEDALQHSRKILSMQAIEDAPELMFIYKQLGLIMYWRGAYTDAMPYLHLALQMTEECANTHKCADTLLAIGGVAYAQGEWSYAKHTLQRCHKIYQTQGYHWGIAHTLRFFGMIALAQGDSQAAQQYYQESLALARQISNRIGEALVFDQLGLLYLAEYQLAQSREVIQQSLTIFQEIGVDVGSARAFCHLARVAIAEENNQAAQEYCLQALQIAQRVQAPPVLIECMADTLHLWLRIQGDTSGNSSPNILLWSLRQHPACSTDTKQYINSLLGDQQILQTHTVQPWPLERILATVTTWITTTFQPQTIDRLRSMVA
jgi:DNA-binding SARP family transcriptional activator/predicted ATPase